MVVGAAFLENSCQIVVYVGWAHVDGWLVVWGGHCVNGQVGWMEESVRLWFFSLDGVCGGGYSFFVLWVLDATSGLNCSTWNI